MCVLIVDDCKDAHLPLKTLLQGHGYQEVWTACSAKEAFDLLDLEGAQPEKEPHAQVVLMDVYMPDIDGIEACRRIKAANHLRHLPILILTGNTDEETLKRAFDAGACDFICKPCQSAELLARVRSALNLKSEIDRCQARERELVRVTEQLRRLNEELERLAVLDELTGIANRRYFNMVLEQEWGRAVRAVTPLSLILIDIDNFKGYNDRYGHLRGDECLRLVSDRLKAMMKRPGDQVARYGGEEFVIILAHTGANGAVAVAERVRQAVEEMALEHACSPTGRSVTVSLGVATTIPDRHGSAGDLLAAADQALYEAKRSGRNQVRVFRDLVAPSVLKGPHEAMTVAER